MNKPFLAAIYLPLLVLSLSGIPSLGQAETTPDPATDKQSVDGKDKQTATEVEPQPAPDLLNRVVPGAAIAPNVTAVPGASLDSATGLTRSSTIQPAMPPNLLPRPPIPTPPAVTLLSPMNGGRVKDPLSWRARAYKLRTESSDAKNGLVKGSRLINANFDDTLSALAAVCSSTGLTIDSIFESAGQVLAHPNDASLERSRIIFSVRPVTKTSTLVRVGLDADNHLKQTSFDDLLNRIETSVIEKGLL
jgi:hypothetical protein